MNMFSQSTLVAKSLKISSLLMAFAVLGAHPAAAQVKLHMAIYGGGTSKVWETAIAAPFRQATGIDVKFDDGDPPTSIRAHVAKPLHQLALVDMNSAYGLLADGLVAKLSADDYPELAGVPKNAQLLAPDGSLMGVSVYSIAYGIAVNTDLASPSAFSSWKDLSNPKWKGKLGITRTSYASIFDLTIMSFANGGTEANIDPALADFRAFVTNATTVAGSTAQVNQLLMQGEIAAIPYYGTRVWDLRRQGVKNVVMVVPREGALAINYVVVVPAGVPITPEIKKFLEYVTTVAPQLRTLDLAGYLPLNPRAVSSNQQEAAEGMSVDAVRQRLISADPSVVAQKQRERVNLLEQMYAGTK